MSTALQEAQQQLQQLQPTLSPARRERIAKRLAFFEKQLTMSPLKNGSPPSTLFLLRPGAPPRPIPAALFTLHHDQHD